VPVLCPEDLMAFDPGGSDRFRCPLPACRKAEGRNLGVTGELWHCFRCGASGRLEGVSYEPGEIEQKERSNVWKKLWNESQPIKPGTAWRGITKWGPSRFHPSFYRAACVVFPSYRWTGSLIGCQGRKLKTCSGSRVLTAAGSSLGLFATSAIAWFTDPLIICEGPLDALSLEELGYPAMATFGVTLPKWINRLTWWRRVAIATDADEAGDRAADLWKKQLMCRGIQRLRPQRCKDWNEWLQADREGMRRYLDQEVFTHTGDSHIFCPVGIRPTDWT
jgi:hypothetical protein